jgi:hypothetical protein
MQLCDEFQNGTATCLRAIVISFVAAMAVAGCGSADEPVTVAVKPIKREQAPEDPTAKMARAVTIGKSNVAVNLKYDILNKPIVGAPVEIELAVIPTFGADSIDITFVGSDGLTVSADSAPSIDQVKAAQVERVKLSVQAAQATVYYVTVTATVYTAGTSSVRNFAIPIIMSAPVVAAEPTVTTESAATAPAPVKKS